MDGVHYCIVRCHYCGYFCQKPICHSDLHYIGPQNMNNLISKVENRLGKNLVLKRCVTCIVKPMVWATFN